MGTATRRMKDSSTANGSETESSARKLMRSENRQEATLQIQENGRFSLREVPWNVLPLFENILKQTAQGKTVSLVSTEKELTTQEAADLLNVSRPFFVSLLEEGKIPFRKVGTKRRVLAKDVLNFKKKTDKQRLRTLAKLAEQAQKLGMGY